MEAVLIAVSAAFCCSVLVTPVVRACVARVGLIDYPDKLRRGHSGAVARGGGAAVAFAILAASAVLGSVDVSHAPLTLLLAVLIVFAIGLADDFWRLQAWQKLAGQLAAAVLAFAGGIRFPFPEGGASAWVLILTALWLTACSNAFNLIDGVDGLASGLGVVASAVIGVALLLHGEVALAVLGFSLTGALLGFLVYNINPASIFLGDSGSLVTGFLMGMLSIEWMVQAPHWFSGFTAACIALSVPLADTGVTVLRRYLRRWPLFRADRSHIHHRLLKRGFTTNQVCWTLWTLALIGGLLGLVQVDMQGRLILLIPAVCAVFAISALWWLDYAELRLASRMLLRLQLRERIRNELAVDAWRRPIAAARSLEECWSSIGESYLDAGFSTAEVCWGGRTVMEPKSRSRKGTEVCIPLPEGGSVKLSGMQLFDDASTGYIRLLSTELPVRIRQLISPNPAVTTPMPANGALRRRLWSASVLLAAVVFLWAVQMASLMVSVRRLAAAIARLGAGRGRRIQEAGARRIGWAVEMASRTLPGSGRCLVKALTVQLLLGLCGWPSTLQIAVYRNQSGAYEGHAWIEHRQFILIGGESHAARHCVPIASFKCNPAHVVAEGESVLGEK